MAQQIKLANLANLANHSHHKPRYQTETFLGPLCDFRLSAEKKCNTITFLVLHNMMNNTK
jgi:hypothetical protein